MLTRPGPVEVVGQGAHGADRQGAAPAKTRRPYADPTWPLPWWRLGWDVCGWMGPRRGARQWSVPQRRGALADPEPMPLSAEAIEDA
jgi:hypothetical protein